MMLGLLLLAAVVAIVGFVLLVAAIVVHGENVREGRVGR
jgi:hypothetical protein